MGSRPPIRADNWLLNVQISRFHLWLLLRFIEVLSHQFGTSFRIIQNVTPGGNFFSELPLTSITVINHRCINFSCLMGYIVQRKRERGGIYWAPPSFVIIQSQNENWCMMVCDPLIINYAVTNIWLFHSPYTLTHLILYAVTGFNRQWFKVTFTLDRL